MGIESGNLEMDEKAPTWVKSFIFLQGSTILRTLSFNFFIRGYGISISICMAFQCRPFLAMSG
jgi:hypothetical protein